MVHIAGNFREVRKNMAQEKDNQQNPYAPSVPPAALETFPTLEITAGYNTFADRKVVFFTGSPEVMERIDNMLKQYQWTLTNVERGLLGLGGLKSYTLFYDEKDVLRALQADPELNKALGARIYDAIAHPKPFHSEPPVLTPDLSKIGVIAGGHTGNGYYRFEGPAKDMGVLQDWLEAHITTKLVKEAIPSQKEARIRSETKNWRGKRVAYAASYPEGQVMEALGKSQPLNLAIGDRVRQARVAYEHSVAEMRKNATPEPDHKTPAPPVFYEKKLSDYGNVDIAASLAFLRSCAEDDNKGLATRLHLLKQVLGEDAKHVYVSVRNDGGDLAIAQLSVLPGMMHKNRVIERLEALMPEVQRGHRPKRNPRFSAQECDSILAGVEKAAQDMQEHLQMPEAPSKPSASRG